MRLSVSSSSGYSDCFSHPRSSYSSAATSPGEGSMAVTKPTTIPAPAMSAGAINELAAWSADLVSYLWLDADQGVGPYQATSRFSKFMNDVLALTQVSESVVVLALLYIHRLKRLNKLQGQPGSEYLVAICSLMLANKWLDDNTYTAQTWSTVSSLSLKSLTSAEKEFLQGLRFQLSVQLEEYRNWERLLDGLKAAAKTAQLNKRRRVDRHGASGPRSDYTPSWPVPETSTLPSMKSHPHPSEQYRPMAPLPARANSQQLPPLAVHQSHSFSFPPPQLPPLSKSRKRSFQAEVSPPPYADFFASQRIQPTPHSAVAVHTSSAVPQLHYLAQPAASPQVPTHPGRLAFYSLAAGQRHGIPQHLQPPQAPWSNPMLRPAPSSRPSSSSQQAYAPPLRPGLSTFPMPTHQPARSSMSSSPLDFQRRASQPNTQMGYLPSGLPLRSPFLYSLPPPEAGQMQFAPVSNHFSQFANAGLPGVQHQINTAVPAYYSQAPRSAYPASVQSSPINSNWTFPPPVIRPTPVSHLALGQKQQLSPLSRS